MADIDDVLRVLTSVKPVGDGWSARCPAHDDQHASLSISRGTDGRVLVHCHANCAVDDVLAAVGLERRDLFPARDRGRRTIVATYHYTDETGTPLFDVLRYDPKDFRQRRADGIWSMKGVRRTLYRLPQLQGRSWVLVVEGEKDADRLSKLGLAATTSCGGAESRWRAEYVAQLRAAGVQHVVVIPDNDAPGRAHAADVAAVCHAGSLAVKVLTLPDVPPKGDVSDWLAAGGTREQLVALVKATPVYAAAAPRAEAPPAPRAATGFGLTTIGDLLDEPEEVVDWLVADRLTAGGVAIMAAKPKVGKSTCARALALAVARGTSWLGHACEAGTVWYLAFEGRRRDIRAHFRQMGARPSDALRIFVGQAPRDVVADVRRLADEERPALVIIDTMQRFLRASSCDDYAEMTTLLDAVIGITQSSGATLLLLHHAGKADRASLDAVLGSTAITGSADTVILLNRTDRYRTIATVQRVGPDLDEQVIQLDERTGDVRLGPTRQDADSRIVGELLLAAMTAAKQPLTEAQLAEMVDARTILQRAALRQLVCREQAIRTGKGERGSPYLYAVGKACSLVPSIGREQAFPNSLSADRSTPDHGKACSLVPAQGPAREKVEL